MAFSMTDPGTGKQFQFDPDFNFPGGINPKTFKFPSGAPLLPWMTGGTQAGTPSPIIDPLNSMFPPGGTPSAGGAPAMTPPSAATIDPNVDPATGVNWSNATPASPDLMKRWGATFDPLAAGAGSPEDYSNAAIEAAKRGKFSVPDLTAIGETFFKTPGGGPNSLVGEEWKGIKDWIQALKTALGNPGVPDAGATGTNVGTAGAVPDLLKRLESLPSPVGDYSNLLKPPPDLQAQSDKYFQDYLKGISAPSSVEQVQQQLEGQQLQQTLQQIDEDTARQLAKTKMDFQGRGLGGPGQFSDVEAGALGAVEAEAGKTRASARTQMEQADLARLAAREKQVQDAYAQRYGLQSQLAGTEAQMAQQGAFKYADITTRETVNRFNTIVDAMLKEQQMSENDKQFFADLQQRLQMATNEADLNRELTLAQINARQTLQDPTLMDKILKGTQIGSGMLGDIGAGVAIASALV